MLKINVICFKKLFVLHLKMSGSKIEIESMDVDDLCPVQVQKTNTNTKPQAKTDSKHEDGIQINVQSSLSSLLIDSTEKLPNRKILKAKRNFSRVQTKNGDHNHYLILVIDTNVLVEDLNLLKRLIIKFNINNVQIHKIIIPWTVIQELDGLKLDRDNYLVRKVQNAIRFINEQLKLGEHSRLICLEKSFQNQNEKDVFSNNDDLILGFCIQFNENPQKFLPTLTIEKQWILIALITNDINLQNKAIVHQMNCYSLKELIQKYKSPDKTIQINSKREAANSTDKSKRVKTDISATSFRNPSKRFRTISQSSSVDLVKEFPRKNHLTTVSTKMDSPSPSPMDPMTSGSCKELDSKYALETRLAEFIIAKFKETFGNDLWQSTLGVYSPESATLIDSLRKFKSNWVGVFSDYFRRDKKVIQLVNEMLQSVNNRTAENCEKLLQMIELAFESQVGQRENKWNDE